MSTQTLAPDSIISQSGMASGCTLSDLTSSPSSPDANYCSPSGVLSDTTLRASFGTPANPLTTGAGLQKFRVEYKRTGDLGAAIPAIVIRLYETGSGSILATRTVNIPNNYNSNIAELTWDASLLATANGSAVECYVGTVSSSEPPDSANSKIGGIEWVAEVSTAVAGDIAATAPKPTVSAVAAYTAPQPTFNADIAATAPKPTVNATAKYTQQVRAGDVVVTAPKPGVFSATDFQPSGDAGTTGWIRPSGASVKNGTSSGVTVSNVSNISTEDSNNASVNLQRTGGGTLQDSKRVKWNWVDPLNYDSDATVDGIEFVIYSQYSTVSLDSHNIFPFQVASGTAIIEQDNITEKQVDMDTDPDPVYDNAIYFGSKTSLFGLATKTFVSDFIAQNTTYGRNAYLKLRDDNGSGDTSASVLIGHVKMKLWWSIPNIIAMGAAVSLSVTPSDTGALQKIRDVSASSSGSVTALNNVIIGNPYAVASSVSIGVIISPATLSEGMTNIDMNSSVAFSVMPSINGFDMLRNMIAASDFWLNGSGIMGYEQGLSTSIPVSVTMDIPLMRDVEMQTDALGSWFTTGLNPDGLIGNISLETNIPASVNFDPDGLLVNWALYSSPVFSVTGSPVIGKKTNLYANVPLAVTASVPLVADINIASAVTIDGLLVNTSFVKLPVPTFDTRTIYVGARDRDIIVPERDRSLFVTRQQRNP